MLCHQYLVSLSAPYLEICLLAQTTGVYEHKLCNILMKNYSQLIESYCQKIVSMQRKNSYCGLMLGMIQYCRQTK